MKIIAAIDEMYLEPENERDRIKLENLLKRYVVVGFGRDQGGRLLHVRIELEAKQKKGNGHLK